MNVFVTGGSGDIGSIIIELFKSNDHLVYAPNRKQLNLQLPINLKHRQFDIIINNAAINPLKSILDIINQKVMTINYTSHLHIIQQCLPYMIQKQYGRIINIGSIRMNTTKPNRLAYSASKNALHSLTHALTVQYSHLNILTNTISPGYINTKMTHQNNSQQTIQNIVKGIPVRRLGTPEQIAKLVYFLTIENTYITGQNIIIDGGLTCLDN